jgi:hypothetical protein
MDMLVNQAGENGDNGKMWRLDWPSFIVGSRSALRQTQMHARWELHFSDWPALPLCELLRKALMLYILGLLEWRLVGEWFCWGLSVH